MQSQAVSVELEEFIRREVGLSPKRQLHAANTMEDDFGVTDADADELMGAFAKRFNVAPTDFDFNR